MPFTNWGTVRLNAGGLAFAYGYVQMPGAETQLNGRTLEAAFVINQGAIKAPGTIIGDVTNQAQIFFLEVGVLAIQGDFTQTGGDTTLVANSSHATGNRRESPPS